MLDSKSIELTYFDGHNAKSHLVHAYFKESMLHIEGDGINRVVAIAEVDWPERQRHGQRQASLPNAGLLTHHDSVAWDAWVATARGESLVVSWQQSWSKTLLAMFLVVGFAAAGWQWGIPLLARGVVHFVPAEIEQQIGRESLKQIQDIGLLPSQLPLVQQQKISQDFNAAIAVAYPSQQVPHTLHFLRSGKWPIGPNAFALPGGDVVLTDELVELLHDSLETVTAILAHEYGHVIHKHSLQLAAEGTLSSALVGLMLGDVSSWVASVPIMLQQMAYSRDLEREADEESIKVMHANRISTEVMVLFFERIKKQSRRHDAEDETLSISFSSHPADAERIARFRAAAKSNH